MKRTVLIVVSFLMILLMANLLVGGFFRWLDVGDSWADGLDTLVGYCASMGLTIGLLRGFKRSLGLVVPSLKPEIGRIHLPLVLLGWVLILASDVALHPIASLFDQEWIEPINALLSGGLWAAINAVVAAPILEEYLMRGVVQNSLERSSGRVWVGILGSAVLFGAIHLIPQQVLAATAAGVILGAIYAVTRSLHTVVLIHMLVNGSAYLQFLFLGEDFDALETICPTTGGYATAVAGAWVVLGVCGVWAVRKIRKK